MRKLFSILFLLTSFIGFSQNKTIDSLLIALKATKEDTNKVISLNIISEHLLNNGNYDECLVYVNKALKLSQQLIPSYKKGESAAYFYLGKICVYKPDYSKAMEYYFKGFKIDSIIGNKKGMSNILGGMGEVFHYRSNYSKALEYYFKALKLDEEIKDKHVTAKHLEYIGVLFGSASDHSKALEYFLRALKLNEEIGDKRAISFNLNSVAQAFYFLDNPKAIEYYERSLKLAEEINYKKLQAVVSGGLGMIYLENKDPAKALVYYLKAQKISEELLDNDLIFSSSNDLGYFYLTHEKYNEAFPFLMKALSIANSENRINDVKEAYKSLSIVYEKSNIALPDLKSSRILSKEEMRVLALYCYKQYVAINDTLFNNDNQRKLLHKEMDYKVEKKETEKKVLAQQNQIQSLQLSQNKFFMIGLCGLTIIILIVAYLVFRQNKFRNEQREMQLEQKLLRSQMNPHFIFNSLQAIQNYILKNDQKEAVKYLSSFANITRSVLENSRMDIIPLKKEVALLENYLHLQKLRFGNRFDYQIHIDPEIDSKTIELPPMLSQPFIENALEHGMRDIESGGKIDIYFTVKDNNLLFEIKDNGRGIQTEDVSIKKHQSLALSITKERIALMNRKKSKKTLFNISEAFPNEIERKGVKVQFSIPI